MKENLELNSVRASVFVPKIAYNSANIQRLMRMFPEYLPSVVDVLPKQLQMLGIKINYENTESQPWQLSTPDLLTKISFYDNKIDIVKSFPVVEKYSEDKLKEISQSVNALLAKIVEAYGFTATRLALAPSVVLPLVKGDISVSDISRKIFQICDLEKMAVDNCDFKQVYHLSRKISNKDYLVNHLCKFSTEMVQKLNSKDLSIFPLLKIDIDINTSVKPDYSFDRNDINSFFNQSYLWSQSLLNIYFDKFDL